MSPAKASIEKPLIFLDRDGVINRFPGKGAYVTRLEAFEFLPGAVEAIRELTEAGFEIVVVSNQGCVSRGLLTQKDLDGITEKMLSQVQRSGGRIQTVHYCLHQRSDQCECKKPKTFLYEKTLAGRSVDRGEVFVIGDSEEDIEAGSKLGCRTILVLSGRTSLEDAGLFSVKPDWIKKDLKEAVRWILQKKS